MAVVVRIYVFALKCMLPRNWLSLESSIKAIDFLLSSLSDHKNSQGVAVEANYRAEGFKIPLFSSLKICPIQGVESKQLFSQRLKNFNCCLWRRCCSLTLEQWIPGRQGKSQEPASIDLGKSAPTMAETDVYPCIPPIFIAPSSRFHKHRGNSPSPLPFPTRRSRVLACPFASEIRTARTSSMSSRCLVRDAYQIYHSRLHQGRKSCHKCLICLVDARCVKLNATVTYFS